MHTFYWYEATSTVMKVTAQCYQWQMLLVVKLLLRHLTVCLADLIWFGICSKDSNIFGSISALQSQECVVVTAALVDGFWIGLYMLLDLKRVPSVASKLHIVCSVACLRLLIMLLLCCALLSS